MRVRSLPIAAVVVFVVACGTSAGDPSPGPSSPASDASPSAAPVRTECRPAPADVKTSICDGTCGNGKVDDCTPPCRGGGVCAPVVEECDDGIAAPLACAELGYASGTASCRSCLVTADGCEACVAGSGALGCAVVSADARAARQPSIVADGDDVVVAYRASPSSDRGAGIFVARVKSDGTVAETQAFDAACEGYAPSIARTPSGFVVAWYGSEGTSVLALTPAFAARGEPRLVDAKGWAPVLVDRVDGGPLLMWTSGDDSQRANLFVELLGEDATSARDRRDLGTVLGDGYTPGGFSGAYAAGRFYVGFRPMSQGRVEIHVIEATGDARVLYTKPNGGVPLLAARGETVRAFVRDAAFDAKEGDVLALDGGALGASSRLVAPFVPLAVALRSDGSLAPVGGTPSAFGADHPSAIFVGDVEIAKQPMTNGIVTAVLPAGGAALAWSGGMTYPGVLGGDPRKSPIHVAWLAL